MATTKLYLDTRFSKKGTPAPLKLSITRKGQTSLLSLNISIKKSQWDKKATLVIAHPNKKFLNTYLAKRKLAADTVILKLISSGEIGGMNATQIKNRIVSELFNENKDLFTSRFEKFTNTKLNERTKQIYAHTLSRIRKFDDKADNLRFEDITKDWLIAFDKFLSLTAPSKNSRNIHLRNIRAVFNDAIDNNITQYYPFRKFKIKGVQTAKRSLTVEQLKILFNYNVEPYQQKYIDMFKLIFYLIGINIVDLCHLKEINNGRIEYYRAKTGKLYSIRVEPEAMEIIEKYKGEKYLLSMLDRYSDYRDYAKRLNENLQRIGKTKRVGRGGKKIIKPLFPNITTYWARHTWATIAAEIDIPKETIAAALGHSIGNPITSIYINFNQNKVDDANRQVLDYIKNARTIRPGKNNVSYEY